MTFVYEAKYAIQCLQAVLLVISINYFPIFQYFAGFFQYYSKSSICAKSSNFSVFSKFYQYMYLCSEFSIKYWQIRILGGYGVAIASHNLSVHIHVIVRSEVIKY